METGGIVRFLQWSDESCPWHRLREGSGDRAKPEGVLFQLSSAWQTDEARPTPLPYVPIAIAVTQFYLIWVHQYQRKDLKTTPQLPGLVSNPQKREIFHNQDSHENSILLRLKDYFW